MATALRASFVMRSIIANSLKTNCIRSSSSISSLSASLLDNQPSTCNYNQLYHFGNLNGIRYNSTLAIDKSIDHVAVNKFDGDLDVSASKSIPAVESVTGDGGTTGNLASVKWEIATDVLSKPILTGPIIPFADQNIIQNILFPYTYSIMYYLDFLTCHMPWWAAIVGTTVTVRILLFPLLVKQNIQGIKTANILPQTQELQVKINDAMCAGDAYKRALYSTKLKLLYNEHGLNLRNRLTPILLQTPMFLSIFLLLRRLSTEQLDSLTTGGALWFTNLAAVDPYYVLPIATCASMFVLLEYGLEGSNAPGTMTPVARYLTRLLPVGLFAFVFNFPSAILLFWTTNNILSLGSAMLLRKDYIKKVFKIPDRIKHDPESLPLTNQSFKSQIKRAMDQGRNKRTIMDVRRLDDIAFRKAGVGPLRKTYKEPPPQASS